jgi:hypothetical protein
MPTLRYALLALAVAVVLAGCSVPIVDDRPTTDVSVSVTNRADTTHEVRTAVVPDGFEAVDVTYRNGSTRRLLVTGTSEIRPAALRNATNLSVVGATVQNRVFRLGPDSGRSTVYEDISANVSVVYAAWPVGADRISNYGTLSCSYRATYLDASVTLYVDGNTDTAVDCGG